MLGAHLVDPLLLVAELRVAVVDVVLAGLLVLLGLLFELHDFGGPVFDAFDFLVHALVDLLEVQHAVLERERRLLHLLALLLGGRETEFLLVQTVAGAASELRGGVLHRRLLDLHSIISLIQCLKSTV